MKFGTLVRLKNVDEYKEFASCSTIGHKLGKSYVATKERNQKI